MIDISAQLILHDSSNDIKNLLSVDICASVNAGDGIRRAASCTAEVIVKKKRRGRSSERGSLATWPSDGAMSPRHVPGSPECF